MPRTADCQEKTGFFSGFVKADPVGERITFFFLHNAIKAPVHFKEHFGRMSFPQSAFPVRRGMFFWISA